MRRIEENENNLRKERKTSLNETNENTNYLKSLDNTDHEHNYSIHPTKITQHTKK